MKDFLSEQLTRNGYNCELVTISRYRIFNFKKKIKGEYFTYEQALKVLDKARIEKIKENEKRDILLKKRNKKYK